MKALVAAVCISAFLIFSDRQALIAYAGRISLLTWIAITTLAATQIFITAVRWWVILSSRVSKLPFVRILEFHLIGLLVNSFLLSGLGTMVVRAGLATRLQIPIATGAASVITDKVVALSGLALLILLSAPAFLIQRGQFLNPAFEGLTTWAAPAFALMVLGALMVFVIPVAPGLRSGCIKIAAETGRVCRDMARDPAMVVRALALTIFGQTFLFLAAFVIANGMGIDVAFWQLLMVLPSVSFLASIPITIGGWGVREGAMIFGLSLLGVDYEAALTLSIVLGIASTLAILPAGLLCRTLVQMDTKMLLR